MVSKLLLLQSLRVIIYVSNVQNHLWLGSIERLPWAIIYYCPFCRICISYWKVTNFNMLFFFLIIDEALTSTLIYAKLESAFEMTAKAYCCLKYCNFCSSKGTSIPTFGSRKVMEWSKSFLLSWTGFLVVTSICLYWIKKKKNWSLIF